MRSGQSVIFMKGDVTILGSVGIRAPKSWLADRSTFTGRFVAAH